MGPGALAAHAWYPCANRAGRGPVDAAAVRAFAFDCCEKSDRATRVALEAGLALGNIE